MIDTALVYKNSRLYYNKAFVMFLKTSVFSWSYQIIMPTSDKSNPTYNPRT